MAAKKYSVTPGYHRCTLELLLQLSLCQDSCQSNLIKSATELSSLTFEDVLRANFMQAKNCVDQPNSFKLFCNGYNDLYYGHHVVIVYQVSIARKLVLTSTSNMSTIILSHCSPFALWPLKTMLLNCSCFRTVVLTDWNDIFVIIVLCGILAESNKWNIYIFRYVEVSGQS